MKDPAYAKRAGGIGKLTVVPRSEGSMSATKIRKAVMEGDLETLRAGVSDKIFESLSSNLGTLQKRGSLLQQRKDKAQSGLSAAQKSLDDFIAVHGNRKKPKEDPSITETRNALKAKLKFFEKRVSGKFKSGVFERMGLGMNLASGFMPNFSGVRLSYGGKKGEKIKNIFKGAEHTQTLRVADDDDTIKNIQFKKEEIGNAEAIFKTAKEIALKGDERQIAKYLKLGNIKQWIQNRKSTDQRVPSLTKKGELVDRERQLTGIVSNMAGAYYEEYIGEKKGLTPSSSDTSRLDFYKTKNKRSS